MKEPLAVTGLAHAATLRVYKYTQAFPREEQFGLTAQLRRAAISIPANIAEGNSRFHRNEYLHFLYVARGSLAEVQQLLLMAKDLEFLPLSDYKQLREQYDQVGRMLNALIVRLRRQTGEVTSRIQDPVPKIQDRLCLNRRGFTLIELLVVIIIIGLLAALVGPKLFGRVGKGKQAAAQAQIELFGAALDNFRLDVGRYPTSDEGLKALLVNSGGIENWDGSYLKKQEIPIDPWNHAYVYTSPGEHGDYDIISFGADGVAGGDGENQDIVSWAGIKRTGERVEQ